MKIFTTLKSPIGTLLIAEENGGITDIDRFTAAPKGMEQGETPLLNEAKRQLNAYFSGALKAFSLPLKPQGTAFMLRVWEELRKIPYGETISYRELARRAGNEKACRAVGQANGKNPVMIAIPCHRVIAADGGLGGYAGGLENKAALLELEKRCKQSAK